MATRPPHPGPKPVVSPGVGVWNQGFVSFEDRERLDAWRRRKREYEQWKADKQKRSTNQGLLDKKRNQRVTHTPIEFEPVTFTPAPRPSPLPEGILNQATGGDMFSFKNPWYEDKYAKLESQYFGEGGLIDSLKGGFGTALGWGPGGSRSWQEPMPTPELDEGIGIARGMLDPNNKDAQRYADLYGTARADVDAWDPDAMAGMAATDARNAAESALRGNMGRMTESQRARARRDAALTGALGSSLGFAAGRAAGLEGRGGAIGRAADVAGADVDRKLGALGRFSEMARGKTQALIQHRQQTIGSVGQLATAWSGALGDWGRRVGQRLGLDVTAQGNALGSYNTWMRESGATDRANLRERGETDRANLRGRGETDRANQQNQTTIDMFNIGLEREDLDDEAGLRQGGYI